MNATEVAAGAACAAKYAKDMGGGWCRCLQKDDNVHGNLARQLRRQHPVTHLLTPSDGFAAASGGLAVLLRGGAFRASRDDTEEMRVHAQLSASTSLAERVVKPYEALGTRVRFFLALYSDVGANATRALYAPYASRVAAVTTLHVGASEQLTMAANILGAFLEVCAAQRERFDAVVLTRFDLRFKMDFTRLLGPDLTRFSGVKYLWRELESGNAWRRLWHPSAEDLDRMNERSRAEAIHVALKMERTRNYTFRPSTWKRSMRTADTFHAFSFSFAKCFRAAVLYEMTRGWVPLNKSLNSGFHHSIDWEHRGGTPPPLHKPPPAVTSARTGEPRSTADEDEAMVNGTGGMSALLDGKQMDQPIERHARPAASTAHLTHVVANHWLHKSKYSLQRTVDKRLGYLIDNGSFDSNPCSGNCLLNPVYDSARTPPMHAL